MKLMLVLGLEWLLFKVSRTLISTIRYRLDIKDYSYVSVFDTYFYCY